MSAKKLDQSVFQGLPSEYRWAAVCPESNAIVFNADPKLHVSGTDWHYTGLNHESLGEGYDATDWQNSLIERNASLNAVLMPSAQGFSHLSVYGDDIDWSRQDVPAGATHYAIQDGGVTWLKDDYSFWSVWDDGEWAACGIPVAQPIPTTPEPQVDWSKAPEGATHYAIKNRQYYKRDGQSFMQWGGDSWCRIFDFTITDLDNMGAVVKPESIHDVARSIEAARVAEKSMPFPDGDPRYFETSDYLAVKISDDQPAAQVIDPPVLGNQGGRAYPHYFKDVSAVDAIDLYHVARLYDITDPALFHAFKKIACAGKRGAKDQAQDVKEAIDALKRWQELNV